VEADYDAVVELLSPHVDDEEIPEERRLRLLRLVSLAYVLQVPPEPAQARVAMETLLGVDPNFRYLEGLAPPEAIALMDDVRASLGISGEGGGDTGEGMGETIYLERNVRRRVRWAAFIPFGVGHFQNGWSSLGYVFAGLEVSALVVNVTTFLAVEGLRGPRGFYSREDREFARNLQLAQFWSLGAMVTLMAVDVLAANLLFVQETVEIRTLDVAPPELSQTPAILTPWIPSPAVTTFVLRSRF
jgi:hypothetical protein